MSLYSRRRPAGLLTADEFLRLPEEEGKRVELVRGRMVREPLPGGEHGVLVGELHARIAAHVRERGLGRALIECGFHLPGEPHTVRGPDVAVVSTERLPAETPRGFWQLAPDLAVEVVSPSDRWTKVLDKVHQYLEAGSRAVWVVDGRRRRVSVFRPGAETLVLNESDVLDGGDVLPGFSLPLAELFRAL
ncbi:MAG: Uma2 family endonuclease [Gemmatimonadetes bacterium]|nr:Uma2 family endonuclease [Gemmatimonadota bacterium]